MMPARMDSMNQNLGWLLSGIADAGQWAGLNVTGLSLDSRSIRAGDLFLACQGTAEHGMAYVDAAIKQGAVLVLAEVTDHWTSAKLSEVSDSLSIPLIPVVGLSNLVSQIAGRFYGEPGRELKIAGITGTNGKTSVSHLLAQALKRLKKPCGLIGTLGYGMPEALRGGAHTTPDPIRLQAELAEMLSEGADSLAMEVSSHALSQGRVVAIPFHTAVFTNLSRDHLDYHGDMSSYGEAKKLLFQSPGLKQAVINVDDEMGAGLAEEIGEPVNIISCGTKLTEKHRKAGFVSIRSVASSHDGLQIDIESTWGEGVIKSPLLGRFNAENLVLVLGVLLGWGYKMGQALAALSGVQSIPGRMQALGGEPLVVIDYAHTPDALEKVLQSLKPHVTGKLVCLFGCGGDRDKGKRPLMGGVAERLADEVILTNDNPRREAGEAIIRDILTGVSYPEVVVVEPDRARAIDTAVKALAKEDVLLIAGKGHEDYQIVGDLKLPFSDLAEARKALEERAR